MATAAPFLSVLATVATLVMMQGFPIMAYALVSSRVAWSGKALAISGYLICAFALIVAGHDAPVAIAAHTAAFGYIVLCALGVRMVSMRKGPALLRNGVVTFVGLSFMLLLVPGVFFAYPASFVAVTWGFELLFSAYSYLHEARTRPERPLEDEDALFFLLVDPVLCLPDRSRCVRPPGLHEEGLRRLALGVGSLVLHSTLIVLLLESGSVRAPQGIVLLAAYYSLRLFAAYARHSGGASVAIACMALLGYQTPERYINPWLASSPADFWRRWNIYLGSWARRYVFGPVAGSSLRALRKHIPATSLSKVIAIVATFGLIGLLHDFAVFAQHGRWPLGGLLVFEVHAFVLIAWSAFPRPVISLSRALFLPVLVMTVAIAIPTMSTDFALTADDVQTWLSRAWHKP